MPTINQYTPHACMPDSIDYSPVGWVERSETQRLNYSATLTIYNLLAAGNNQICRVSRPALPDLQNVDSLKSYTGWVTVKYDQLFRANLGVILLFKYGWLDTPCHCL